MVTHVPPFAVSEKTPPPPVIDVEIDGNADSHGSWAVLVAPSLAAVGPLIETTFVTAFAVSRGMIVPRADPVNVSVYGPDADPVTLVTDHPVAAPTAEKSAVARPVTSSSKLMVKVVPPALFAE